MHRPTHRMIMTVLAVTATTMLVGACGPTATITADTLCSDYLKRPGDERADAAIRLSSELRVKQAGNPMWAPNLDYNCGQAPRQTVRKAFGK